MRKYPTNPLMTESMRTAFTWLRPENFPLDIEAFDTLGHVVWTQHVPTPGDVVVPELSATHGPVGVRFRTADGIIAEQDPPRGWV